MAYDAKPLPAEESLWKKLKTLDPSDVCKRAGVSFIEEKKEFGLNVFHNKYNISYEKFTPDMHPHLRFLALYYLCESKDLCPTGKLKPLHELKGGQFFFTGSHQIPLHLLANKFGDDAEAFYNKGISLGGDKVNYGDMAICLYPLPKIPITYILWKRDSEFPARVTLLFDETAEKHFLLEELWGISLLTTHTLLR